MVLNEDEMSDAIRLALVGLDDSTVFVDGFFSQEKRLEGLRQAALIEGLVEQEQNKLEHEIHLKMGNENLPDIPKGKGNCYYGCHILNPNLRHGKLSPSR